MKLLLFVQSEDDRPICAGEASRDPDHKSRHTYELAEGIRGSWLMARAQREADHWWLVLCEHADDGRTVITQERVGRGSTATLGRILASGGKVSIA